MGRRRRRQAGSSIVVGIWSGRSILVAGTAAFLAIETDYEEKERAEREADEQDNFNSRFHFVDRNPSFALTRRHGQDEYGEPI